MRWLVQYALEWRIGVHRNHAVAIVQFACFEPLTTDTIRNVVRDYLLGNDAIRDKYGPMDEWDTHLVTSLRNLFHSKMLGSMYALVRTSTFSRISLDISRWDTSNVTNMNYTFFGCKFPLPDISQWDMSNVRTAKGMLRDTSFNSDVNHWNVSRLQDARWMFYGCMNFNQCLDDWDVSSLQRASFMFSHCRTFNQPLNQWDVRQLRDCDGMFSCCNVFNQPLDRWRLSSAQSMEFMFRSCFNMEQSLANWCIPTNVNVRSMFTWNGRMSHRHLHPKQEGVCPDTFAYNACSSGIDSSVFMSSAAEESETEDDLAARKLCQDMDPFWYRFIRKGDGFWYAAENANE